jgi:hypothetical protein
MAQEFIASGPSMSRGCVVVVAGGRMGKVHARYRIMPRPLSMKQTSGRTPRASESRHAYRSGPPPLRDEESSLDA